MIYDADSKKPIGTGVIINKEKGIFLTIENIFPQAKDSADITKKYYAGTF